MTKLLMVGNIERTTWFLTDYSSCPFHNLIDCMTGLRRAELCAHHVIKYWTRWTRSHSIIARKHRLLQASPGNLATKSSQCQRRHFHRRKEHWQIQLKRTRMPKQRFHRRTLQRDASSRLSILRPRRSSSQAKMHLSRARQGRVNSRGIWRS